MSFLVIIGILESHFRVLWEILSNSSTNACNQDNDGNMSIFRLIRSLEPSLIYLCKKPCLDICFIRLRKNIPKKYLVGSVDPVRLNCFRNLEVWLGYFMIRWNPNNCLDELLGYSWGYLSLSLEHCGKSCLKAVMQPRHMMAICRPFVWSGL